MPLVFASIKSLRAQFGSEAGADFSVGVVEHCFYFRKPACRINHRRNKGYFPRNHRAALDFDLHGLIQPQTQRGFPFDLSDKLEARCIHEPNDGLIRSAGGAG